METFFFSVRGMLGHDVYTVTVSPDLQVWKHPRSDVDLKIMEDVNLSC